MFHCRYPAARVKHRFRVDNKYYSKSKFAFILEIKTWHSLTFVLLMNVLRNAFGFLLCVFSVFGGRLTVMLAMVVFESPPERLSEEESAKAAEESTQSGFMFCYTRGAG